MAKNKEIELKIPLSDGEYDDLKKRYFSGTEKVLKKDEYFSRYDTLEERIKNNEPKVIRIRTEGEEVYFTIKRKSIKNGIEVNEEKESFSKEHIEYLKTVPETFEIPHYVSILDLKKK